MTADRQAQVDWLREYEGPDMSGEAVILFPGTAEDLLDRLAVLAAPHGDRLDALREARDRYEASPVNLNDRPESWAALDDLLDAVDDLLADAKP